MWVLLPCLRQLILFQGVWGAIFSKLNIRWAKNVRGGTWVKSHPIVEVFLVGRISFRILHFTYHSLDHTCFGFAMFCEPIHAVRWNRACV